MRAFRAAVLTVRTSVDFSRLFAKLVVAVNVVAGVTAVLLAGLLAVAMSLD